MSQHETKTFSSTIEIKDADKGIAEIVFATFHAKDHDGDVTLPGAFAGNNAVVVSAYGHKSWDGELPVGTARIHETDKDARATIEFFMDTPHGAATFHTVKGLARKGLGDYSYGFEPVERGDPTPEMQKDGIRRVLKRLKVFEVSPVLRGAGIGTRTLVVKGRKAAQEDVATAIEQLGRAIARHERHMNGTEPVDGPDGERSQQAMMDEMRAALSALTDEGQDGGKSAPVADVPAEPTEEEKRARYEITAKGRAELARFIQTMTRLAS